jgi:hypothetical protein
LYIFIGVKTYLCRNGKFSYPTYNIDLDTQNTQKKLVKKEQTLIFITETPDFQKNFSKFPSRNFQEYFTNSDLEITTYIFPRNILF